MLFHSSGGAIMIDFIEFNDSKGLHCLRPSSVNFLSYITEFEGQREFYIILNGGAYERFIFEGSTSLAKSAEVRALVRSAVRGGA